MNAVEKSAPTPRFMALVLAASRGAGDPVAEARGEGNKALVRVIGVPMLWRVIDALRRSPAVARTAVSAEDDAILEGLPDRDSVVFAPSGASPSDSVRRAIGMFGNPFPILVTTADHPLLTPAMVDYFCREAVARDSDIVVALAPASVILRAHPETRRTFLAFRDGRYSGCNLFALMTPAALGAVDLWSGVERYRKRPWRLWRALGSVAFLLAVTHIFTLEQAVARLGARLGVRAAAVAMPFAEAAIDVDRPEDLELVERILAERGEGVTGMPESLRPIGREGHS